MARQGSLQCCLPLRGEEASHTSFVRATLCARLTLIMVAVECTEGTSDPPMVKPRYSGPGADVYKVADTSQASSRQPEQGYLRARADRCLGPGLHLGS
jgi:hypothetical protein